MGGLALTKYSPEGGIQMGRRNKAYFKDLHQQAYEKLIAMQAFGESKKQAIANGTEKDKIFFLTHIKPIGSISNILLSISILITLNVQRLKVLKNILMNG